MSARSVVDWLAFQVVWFAIALGAAKGISWPGIALALAYAAVAWWRAGWSAAYARIAVACAAAGVALDSVFVLTGRLRFVEAWPLADFVPAWDVALWLAFAATLGPLAAVLGAVPVGVQAALGAIAGPLAYLAGARLGALQIGEPYGVSVVAIAVGWAVLLPGLLALQRRAP